MHVLLIDDDDDAVSLLQMMLRRKGVRSAIARSIREARQILAEHDDVDTVVTDYELGDGDTGLMLHAECSARKIRFVVLTGRADIPAPDDVVVLQKPVELPTLLASIGYSTA